MGGGGVVRSNREPDRLQMHILAAIARGDAALAAWVNTRNVEHLKNGLLDVRNRLYHALPEEVRDAPVAG